VACEALEVADSALQRQEEREQGGAPEPEIAVRSPVIECPPEPGVSLDENAATLTASPSASAHVLDSRISRPRSSMSPGRSRSERSCSNSTAAVRHSARAGPKRDSTTAIRSSWCSSRSALSACLATLRIEGTLRRNARAALFVLGPCRVTRCSQTHPRCGRRSPRVLTLRCLGRSATR